MTQEPTPQRPAGNGQIMDHIRRLWDAMKRQRIVPGVGYTVTESPQGTSLRVAETTAQPPAQTAGDGGTWI